MSDELYELLPRIHRTYDESNGYPLRDFLRILQAENARVRRHIDELYDDLFVETARQPALARIAELIDSHPTPDLPPRRSEIADMIASRSQKGTLRTLEEITAANSGWTTRAIEAERHLSASQHMRSVRPDRGRLVDVRNSNEIALVGTASDRESRRPEVRRPDPTSHHDNRGRGRRGLHAPRTVSLFVWTRDWYRLDNAELRQVPGRRDRFTFSPFGIDTPIQHTDKMTGPDPDLGQSPTSLEDLDIPGQLTIQGRPTLPGQVVSADLSSWKHQPREKGVLAYVDRARGRVLLGPGLPREADPPRLRSTFWYPFALDIGGGPYKRLPSITDSSPSSTSESQDRTEPQIVTIPGNSLVYPAAESTTHHFDVDADQTLWLAAEHGCRPTFVGDVSITVAAGATIIVEGIGIAGTLSINPVAESANTERPASFTISDCTIWPSDSAYTAVNVSDVAGSISRSITGPIRTDHNVSIVDSIVDGRGGVAIRQIRTNSPHRVATVERSTLLGRAELGSAQLQSALLAGTLSVADPSISRAEHSFLPAGSSTLAVNSYSIPSTLDHRNPVALNFVSTTFGDPRYAQLAWDSADQLFRGANNGSEVGVYNRAHFASRTAAMTTLAKSFVPIGFDVGCYVAG